ncbi:hypothetical protein C0583_03425 [Candidatus Parcubacteria bacterium]|nr:MAG: hypothetical protein C0583_03425 [Candidatus Parcubacteria bacterium]
MQIEQEKTKSLSSKKSKWPIFFWILGFVALFILLLLASIYNYLLFHISIEFTSVIIAGMVFVVSWNSRKIVDNNFFNIIGIAYLFIGVVDFLHTLAYPGMNILWINEDNVSPQLWILARYTESLTIFIGAFFVAKPLKYNSWFWGYFIFTISVIVLIFSGYFPNAYFLDTGLTPFKIGSEYLIVLILFISSILLVKRKKHFNLNVLILILWSIALTIFSEMAFTLYTDPYGIFSLLGHLSKLSSFILIYLSIVVSGVKNPQETIFHNLKEKEESLRRSEKKMRDLFSNMSSGFALHEIITDSKGKPIDFIFKEVNTAFEKMTGLKAIDIIGKTAREVNPDIINDEIDWLKIYGNVAINETSEKIEGFSRALNRWYMVSAYCPAKMQFAVIMEDISERKKIEKDLEAAEKRYRNTLDNMMEGAQLIDYNWRYLYVNNIAARHGRKRKEDLLGKTMMEVYPGIEKTEMFEKLKICMNGGERQRFDNEFQYEDGSRHWFSLGIDSVPEGIFILSTDITERKLVEEKIRLSEEKYKIMAEASPYNIKMLDTNFKIKYMNMPALKKYGFSSYDLVKERYYLNLINKENKDLIKNALEKAKIGVESTIEYKRKQNDEQINIYQELFIPIVSKEKTINNIICVSRNITEETRISDAKTEFISLASHQLRNPLTSAGFGLELLIKGLDKKDEKQLAEDVLTDINFMTSIINKLLNISRIEMGTFSDSPKKINLKKLLNSLYSGSLLLFKKKQIHYIENFSNKLPETIEVDIDILKNIIQNLFMNAIRHTPEKGTIVLSAEKFHDYLLLSVKDTGPGIPESIKPKIFTKMYKAYEMLETESDISGLGLYIAKLFTESLGGKIWFETEIKKGTTFFIKLPFKAIKGET